MVKSPELVIDSSPRIYETRLTEEQMNVLHSHEPMEMFIVVGTRPDDVLGDSVNGAVVRCFSDPDEDSVIVPGSELATWLRRLYVTTEDHALRSRYTPEVAVYELPGKAYVFPKDRGYASN